MAIFHMDIIRQLELIISHPAFNKERHKTTRNQIGLLVYIVNQVLSGKSDLITSGSIAETIFGRQSGSYDPKDDPIVRLYAGLLRRSLIHYYQTAGKNDHIIIELPEDTYVPIIKINLSRHKIY